MYPILLWFLRLSCALCLVDSEALLKAPKAHKVITPEGFGY